MQCRRHSFYPWVRKIPWRKTRQSTLVFLPREFHGQKRLVGYSPGGWKELDTRLKWLTLYTTCWRLLYFLGRSFLLFNVSFYLINVFALNSHLAHFTFAIKCFSIWYDLAYIIFLSLYFLFFCAVILLVSCINIQRLYFYTFRLSFYRWM